MFQRFFLYAQDDGAGGAAPIPEEETGGAGGAERPREAPSAPEAEQIPPSVPEVSDTAEGDAKLSQLMRRVVDGEIRAAAALAGVPAQKLGYIARLALVEGADKEDADVSALAAQAVAKVLEDIPELKGSGMTTGSSGAHPRSPLSAPEETARSVFSANL